MGSGAIVIHKQNEYIRKFNDLGAIDPEHSIDLDDAGIRRSYIFNRMVNRGIFIKCDNGKFYIDNAAASQFKENRHKKAIIILAFILALAALYYLIQGR